MKSWWKPLLAIPSFLVLAGLPACRCSSSSSGQPTTDASAPVVRTAAEVRAKGNHLLGSTSPYLLQHAHNPVDWFPWGTEALEKARRENKVIFLSIGYSTCHWCHVMEKESFENDEIATILNQHFVAIKVDREQRPDIDMTYISAVSAMGSSTGWPLTVFLSPALEPFLGGTYFPRESKGNLPGFRQILGEVQNMWKNDRAEIHKRGQRMLGVVNVKTRPAGPLEIGPHQLQKALTRLDVFRDKTLGGFGQQQKFPNAPLLLAELRAARYFDDKLSKEHLILTLEQAARGGIYDPIDGSFHRYTVDRHWHIPHFEKTLYDNVQLAEIYIETGLWLKRDDFVQIGKGVLQDLMARWVDADGGLIVGFDADDAKGEGTYYTWTSQEIDQLLDKDAAKVFKDSYRISNKGDLHLQGRNVLHRNDECASHVDLGDPGWKNNLQASLEILRKAREKRSKPAKDDKVLTAWNGMAIGAFANAARWLDDSTFLQFANKLATHLHQNVYDSKQKLLQRGLRKKESVGPSFLSDYSLLGLGLLRLHAASGDQKWLLWARELADVIQAQYYHPNSHGFRLTPKVPPIAAHGPVILFDNEDGALPSGGSAAILFLLELGAMTGHDPFYKIGMASLQRQLMPITNQPTSASFSMVALEFTLASAHEVVIAGDWNQTETKELWDEVVPTNFGRILPIRLPADGASPALLKAYPALSGKDAQGKTSRAFVCQHGSCQAPTSDPIKLRSQLERKVK
jgi:uncharacterized protein